MSVAAPPHYDKPNYDKNVVQRRSTSRNADLSKTLRAARERLASKGGVSPKFDRELLTRHVQALKGAAIALPLPILLTALSLSIFLGAHAALIWTLVALFGYLVLYAAARQFLRLSPEAPIDAGKWTRILLAGHTAAGLCWAYLALVGCSTCAPLRFDVFQFSVLFLAIALTAMVSSTLRHVSVLAFLPLGAVLVYRIATIDDPVGNGMRIMLLGAVPFFAIVAASLRAGAVERISSQAEKDDLIAELETARTISEEARRRAEEANLAKSRFLATMSHELRTPLNAILGFSEVIANEILGPIGNATYRDYVKDIHDSGQHLLDLINEILDLSRVEAGRYALNEEAVELVTVARDCVNYVSLKCKAKDIRLLVQLEPQLPQIWADERALRQIVLNLLSNAVKFTPNGGEITLRAGWTAGGGQYVSVRDNGPGIAEDEIPIVLSSFGQGSIAIKSAEQGTGLGLPIVQALVHMHDGEFALNSRLREGTEAIAVFPHSRILEVMPAFQTYD